MIHRNACNSWVYLWCDHYLQGAIHTRDRLSTLHACTAIYEGSLRCMITTTRIPQMGKTNEGKKVPSLSAYNIRSGSEEEEESAMGGRLDYQGVAIVLTSTDTMHTCKLHV